MRKEEIKKNKLGEKRIKEEEFRKKNKEELKTKK